MSFIPTSSEAFICIKHVSLYDSLEMKFMSKTSENPSFIKHEIHVKADEGVVDADVFVFDFSEAAVPVLVVGDVEETEQPLARVHSRCIYGQVFRSQECDCQAQLEEARRRVIEADAGIFMFLDQEGRGAGLVNKALMYQKRQQEGLNTVEAYRQLGLEVDQRSYDHAVVALHTLGIQSIKLLTNNPAKEEVFSEAGIEVERVPLKIEPTPHNVDYLKVKQNKLGHDLGIEGR